MTSRIYLARPIDERIPASTNDVIARAKSNFRYPRFEVIDPTIARGAENPEDYMGLVQAELHVLESCDAILVDMSPTDHIYIGCIAELVYARLWNLSTVIYTGSNDKLDRRPWLRFHADHIDATWKGAVEWIQTNLP
jgi:hypothetical protein